MSVDMYLDAARTQASSIAKACYQEIQKEEELIQALSTFVQEKELKGLAYDSAKDHITNVVIPIIQGMILYQESLIGASKKFVDQYVVQVDSKSWRQIELEERIREADLKISELHPLADSSRNSKGLSFVDLSASIFLVETMRQRFQELLTKLLTFNGVSTTFFLEAESYLTAIKSGLNQASSSWDVDSKTYLPTRVEADLGWKKIISSNWVKRQKMIDSMKTPDVSNLSSENDPVTQLEKKIAKLDYDDLMESYSDIVQAYLSGNLNSPYYKPNKNQFQLKLEQLVIERYKELKDQPRESLISKHRLAEVDPAFKKKIDQMSQKELEQAYPGFVLNPAFPVASEGVTFSKTERANNLYLTARYLELDRQNPVSKHDPNFEQKRFEYIQATGMDPGTGKEASQELKEYASNYLKYAPTVKSAYNIAMAGMGAWELGAINKDIQGQRAIDLVDEYYQVKGAVRKNIDSLPLVHVSDLGMTQTVKNHANDLIKRGKYVGQKARPYIDNAGTELLVQEIIDTGIPIKDKFLPNGWRWEVQGSFNGRSEGIWELVIDLESNQIVHFNFVQ